MQHNTDSILRYTKSKLTVVYELLHQPYWKYSNNGLCIYNNILSQNHKNVFENAVKTCKKCKILSKYSLYNATAAFLRVARTGGHDIAIPITIRSIFVIYCHRSVLQTVVRSPKQMLSVIFQAFIAHSHNENRQHRK